jgi:hypothetical protein
MKHVISILTLAVVSGIAILSLLFETRHEDKLTKFGYVVLVLTCTSLILGIAAQIHTIKEERRKASEDLAKHTEQKQHLGRIESEVKASTRPLLPIAMFYTIYHTPEPPAIEKAFGDVNGFRSVSSDILKLVGTARLGGPLGYNSIEATASESHCVLEGDKLVNQIKQHTGFSAIRESVSTILEFFLPVDGDVPSESNLVLEKTFTGHPDEVIRLELFDNLVYQDSLVKNWTGHVGATQSWSIENLHNARVRLTLKFLGECGPVGLHDLQLFFGPVSSMHGIHFPKELLVGAVFKEDPNPLLHPGNDLAKKIFAQHVLEYECVFSRTVLTDHLVKIV